MHANPVNGRKRMGSLTTAFYVGSVTVLLVGGFCRPAAAVDGLTLYNTVSLGAGNWGTRNTTTSQGKVLWCDPNFIDVYFYDGTNVTRVQAGDTDGDGVNDLGTVTDTVFTLGTGATPGSVIGVWRRGTDHVWLWSNDGNPPVKLVVPLKTGDTNFVMNAEALAVADGAVFLALQDTVDAVNFFHVFHLAPGSTNLVRLTGPANVKGFALPLTASAGQAAWAFDDGTRDANTNVVLKLHFYDGSQVREVDSGLSLANPNLNRGRLVYEKKANGITQIFLYDSTVSNATPVPLTSEADPNKGNFNPQTDGRHVAWMNGVINETTRAIVLNGGLTLTGNATPGSSFFRPFELQRGQVLWQDTTGALRYLDGNGVTTAAAAGEFNRPWLADGLVAYLGNLGVLIFAGTSPSDAAQPSSPLVIVATPGSGQVALAWDQVLGASSYNLYLAEQPGLTKDNYSSLVGGQKISGATSPFVLTGLTNRIYFFAVSAVEASAEGPISASSMAARWELAAGAPRTNYYAVAAGLTNGPVAYASGGTAVYATADSGATWSPLAGGIQGLDVRGLAVDGPRVYAATRDIFGVGPARILRSLDAGASWLDIVPDGGEIGEQNKVIVLDPVSPSRLYAADFRLPTMIEPDDSFVVRSANGGTNWIHLPDPTTPLGAEIRAYALAINPLDPAILYAGGSGTPNLVRSSDGGTHWTEVSMGPGFVYALALDPAQPQTIYAANVDFTQTSRGLYKSTDSGSSWVQKNTGFPSPLPRINTLLVDPSSPQQIHAGTDAGHFFSLDGAEHWTAASFGLTTSDSQYIRALTLTATRQLLAATADGIYRLDLSMLNLSRPALGIARSGATATFAWPAAADSFLLESALSLSLPVSWSPVTGLVVVTNGLRTLTVGLTNVASFYRLRKP